MVSLWFRHVLSESIGCIRYIGTGTVRNVSYFPKDLPVSRRFAGR